MATKKIEFGIYDKKSKDAVATIKNGKCTGVKLLIKVSRSYYYSFYNDMMASFQQQYPKYYNSMK